MVHLGQSFGIFILLQQKESAKFWQAGSIGLTKHCTEVDLGTWQLTTSAGDKVKVANEILDSAQDAETCEYKVKDVEHVIHTLERQYLHLTNWLRKKQVSHKNFAHGAVDKQLMAKVRKICPKYCELMPVFQEFNFEITSGGSTSEGEDNSMIHVAGGGGCNYEDELVGEKAPIGLSQKRQREEMKTEDSSSKRRYKSLASSTHHLFVRESHEE